MQKYEKVAQTYASFLASRSELSKAFVSLEAELEKITDDEAAEVRLASNLFLFLASSCFVLSVFSVLSFSFSMFSMLVSLSYHSSIVVLSVALSAASALPS